MCYGERIWRPWHRAVLTPRAVSKLKKFLSHLVVMGIDKGKNRLLLVCPKLFDRLYRATFPCESDPHHFQEVKLCEVDYVAALKAVHAYLRWERLGSFDTEGSPPEPYPLFKLKDILATCAEVQAQKGTCCRNRPISPNTQHWLRRVYKRVGSVLRFVVKQMPSRSVNFIRSQGLIELVESWAEEADPGAEWLVAVGDVSNCYDELDHSRVLEGVQWALHSLPEWLTENQGDRRPVRTVKGFSVHKYDRKDCQLGNSCDLEGNRVNVSSKDVLEVCKFDVQNSVVFVLGKLWRRVRGAPMGGFLSAFYAMLCFGYIEHKCVSPMFAKLGLPGGVRRYLDDVLILVAVQTLDDREKASKFVEWMGSEPYPPPLKLNMEAFGDQEFLETVISGGKEVRVQLQNKRVADLLGGKGPQRARFSTQAPRAVNQALAQGILTRAVQHTRPPHLLPHAVIQLQYEMSVDGMTSGVLKQACRAVALSKTCEKKKKASKVLGKFGTG